MLCGFAAKNHPQQVVCDRVDDRWTPDEIFLPLHEKHNFTLDVAASVENAKCGRFFDLESDGLRQSWNGRVWCNPPYSNLRPWVEKAIVEVGAGRAQVVVMLLPSNRTEQDWWQDLIEPNRDKPGGPRVEFLRGRRRFKRPGWQKPKKGDRPPFGLCIVRWPC